MRPRPCNRHDETAARGNHPGGGRIAPDGLSEAATRDQRADLYRADSGDDARSCAAARDCDRSASRARSAAIPRDARIAIAENPNYSRGQLSSLQVGLGVIQPDSAGAIVHLGDHPMVRLETFRAVVDSYNRTGKPIVIARHDGRRGHPVVFDRSIFAEILSAPEKQGARFVVNADASRVAYVDLDDPGINLDLDTPADLARAGLPPPPTLSAPVRRST